MADSSQFTPERRINGRIKSFEFALTVVVDEAERQVIIERIAQLKRQLSLVKGDKRH